MGYEQSSYKLVVYGNGQLRYNRLLQQVVGGFAHIHTAGPSDNKSYDFNTSKNCPLS